MRQFVLIDQSIRGLTGHHYEYAVHVLGAAAKAGYQPLLAANRKFATQAEKNWRVFPEYEFGFWSEPRKQHLAGPLLERVRRIWFLARCKLRFSFLGLAWLGRNDWAKYLSRRPGGLAGFVTHVLGVLFIVAMKVLRLPVLLILLPFWALALALLAFWELLKLLVRPPRFQRYVRTFVQELKTYAEFTKEVVRPAGRNGTHGAKRSRASERATAAFGRDTGNLFSKVELQACDVVFLPTVSHRDLLGLLEFFRADGLSSDVSWHFLFRRDLYPGTAEDFADYAEEVAEIRSAFQTFQREIGERKVFFYTDSAELTRQYERLETFPFHTLSIPHTYSAQDASVGEGPLQVTYLGDARREKGYHLLPKIVGDLKQEGLAGKLRFIFQSNYNIAGGEPEAVVARGQLESFPEPVVSLYKQALSTADYKALLLSSAITILPYDRTNYGARSSGVLVESLAAGIPAVVPAGTWLSRQLLMAGCADGQKRPWNEMMVVESFGHSSLSWCRHGTSDISAFVDGKLEAGFESKAYCRLDVPGAATHLLFTVRFSKPPLDGCLYITELRADDVELGHMRRIHLQGAESDGSQGKCRVVCRLASQARKLWVALGSAHEDVYVQIEDTRVDLLRQPPGRSVPRGAAGLAYQEVEEIPELIREIADHYPHYRRTAAEFAVQWRNFHNADRLVADITRNADREYGLATDASDIRAEGEPAAGQDIACA